jgi:hypothetical protein
VCGRCSYRTFCPGVHIDDATQQRIDGLAREGYLVAPILDHMTERLPHMPFGLQLLAKAAGQLAG